jgi:hypothetical protein
MPPEQTPRQNQNDPYEFITSPQKQSKFRLNFGNTKGQRIIIVAVSFVLLIIIFFILSSILNSSSNAQKERLISLAQTQTEIIRVSELADKQSSDIDTRASAIITKMTVETDLQETNLALERKGTELNSKALSLKENEGTDKELEDAFANNMFDEEFNTIIRQQLEDYQTLIQVAHASSSGTEKQNLAQSFDEIGLLLERVKSQ